MKAAVSTTERKSFSCTSLSGYLSGIPARTAWNGYQSGIPARAARTHNEGCRFQRSVSPRSDWYDFSWPVGQDEYVGTWVICWSCRRAALLITKFQNFIQGRGKSGQLSIHKAGRHHFAFSIAAAGSTLSLGAVRSPKRKKDVVTMPWCYVSWLGKTCQWLHVY